MLISNQNHDWTQTISPQWLLLVFKFRSTYMRPSTHGIRPLSCKINTCAVRCKDSHWFQAQAPLTPSYWSALYRSTEGSLFEPLAASSRQLSFMLGGLCDRARHPRQYFGWPRRAKHGRPITREWIDPWTLLLPGQHRWAQGAPQMSRASSGWPGAGKTKGSRGLSLSLHISDWAWSAATARWGQGH